MAKTVKSEYTFVFGKTGRVTVSGTCAGYVVECYRNEAKRLKWKGVGKITRVTIPAAPKGKVKHGK
jgi:hypothetical protein